MTAVDAKLLILAELVPIHCYRQIPMKKPLSRSQFWHFPFEMLRGDAEPSRIIPIT